MGHQFTIDDDEAFALVTELATMTGRTVQAAVLDAVRTRLDHERKLRAKLAKVKQLTAEFRELLVEPVPTSDHGFLYDAETGLPV